MLREDIVLKIEELKKETKTYQKLLQIWDKSGLAERTGPAMRFFNARPQTVINALLREKGPQTQEQLMAELQAGGIAVGKKRGMHNTRISIEKTLKTGALKQVGNLIGLPEWSDEKFNG
jgi:hypothetical protein